MYIRNKIVWLRKQGWSAQVISTQKGMIYISELTEFSIFIPEMMFPFYLFSSNKQQEIVEQVIDMIQPQNYEEIVIESTSIEISTWAEVVSKEISAKHIAFLLQEKNVVDNPQLQDFFKFKHQRRELVSITDHSLKMMFESFSPIEHRQSYRLPAYCNNVVEDIDSPFLHRIHWDKYDYKIGCLSRIDKPFIRKAIINFARFVRLHKDKKFLLVLIGGAPDNTPYETNIKAVFKDIENVKLVITGYMFPIPAKLLGVFDTFFTSAGSCWPCMRSGVPTISIDGNDLMPIGIMKHTTLNTLFRGENEPSLDYQDIFEDVIINKKYKKLPSEHEFILPDFATHIQFIENSVSISEYFDVNKVKPITRAEKKIKLGMIILGAVIYNKLNQIKLHLKG